MQRQRKLALLLLAGAVAAFLCYCLGYAQGSQGTRSFSVTSQYAASEEALYQGGDTVSPADALSATEAATDSDALIDLNHADAETLQQLPGIGPERAEAIVRYREENGLFVTTDEVMNVPGIGPGVYAEIEDLVTVDYR